MKVSTSISIGHRDMGVVSDMVEHAILLIGGVL